MHNLTTDQMEQIKSFKDYYTANNYYTSNKTPIVSSLSANFVLKYFVKVTTTDDITFEFSISPNNYYSHVIITGKSKSNSENSFKLVWNYGAERNKYDSADSYDVMFDNCCTEDDIPELVMYINLKNQHAHKSTENLIQCCKGLVILNTIWKD